MLGEATSVAIFAHVHPDGDAIGSTLALYNYTRENFPNVRANVFLEPFPEKFNILRGTESVKNAYTDEEADLVFLLDTPSFERIGANGKAALARASLTCNIDHHVSNPGNLCKTCIVESDSSSASETLFTLLSKEKIGKDTANALYLGIVHDTGVFKFSNTRRRTMDIVGTLIEKGCEFDRIINETYYSRTHRATKITGFAMERSEVALNGKVVYSFLHPEDLKHFDATPLDLSSVIDALREVSGTEVALFVYPTESGYKLSLRSNYTVDVNAIARTLGGGGHVRAAGATVQEPPEAVIPKILEMVRAQLSL